MSYWLKAIEEGHERWKRDLEKLWTQQGKALSKPANLNLLEELDKVWRNPFNTQNLNPNNMTDDNKGFTGVSPNDGLTHEFKDVNLPGPSATAPAITPDITPDMEKLASDTEVKHEMAGNRSIEEVIKQLFDELHTQVLNIRGAGPWEAELQHAAAVAQTL